MGANGHLEDGREVGILGDRVVPNNLCGVGDQIDVRIAILVNLHAAKVCTRPSKSQ